jgi:hypothetical protein
MSVPFLALAGAARLVGAFSSKIVDTRATTASISPTTDYNLLICYFIVVWIDMTRRGR